jgi:hypothetical protein
VTQGQQSCLVVLIMKELRKRGKKRVFLVSLLWLLARV